LFYDVRNLVGLRREEWKYYRRYTTENSSYWPLRQGPFLFNLETDPSESYSMIESEPVLAAEMAALLAAAEADMAANLRGWL